MEHRDTFDPRVRLVHEAICTSEMMCNPQPGHDIAYMARSETGSEDSGTKATGEAGAG